MVWFKLTVFDGVDVFDRFLIKFWIDFESILSAGVDGLIQVDGFVLMFSNRFQINCFSWCQWFDSSRRFRWYFDVFESILNRFWIDCFGWCQGLIQVDSFDGVNVFESILNQWFDSNWWSNWWFRWCIDVFESILNRLFRLALMVWFKSMVSMVSMFSNRFRIDFKSISNQLFWLVRLKPQKYSIS